MPLGGDLHEVPLDVPPHLRHASPRRLRQDLLLNRQRHRGGHPLQATSHQTGLRRIQRPAALHRLRGTEANVHQRAAVVHDPPGPSPRDPQTGREQAGGVEPALLIAHHRRDRAARPPLIRMSRQLAAAGQAGCGERLAPGGPGRQTVAGRRQLPQPRSPQTKQPRRGGLLHAHDFAPLGRGHQGRVTTRLVGEQVPVVSTNAVVGALGAIAVIVVLDSHQQSGQQFLHHAGQLTTGHQRSQQLRRLLRGYRRHRR